MVEHKSINTFRQRYMVLDSSIKNVKCIRATAGYTCHGRPVALAILKAHMMTWARTTLRIAHRCIPRFTYILFALRLHVACVRLILRHFTDDDHHNTGTAQATTRSSHPAPLDCER
jgi:hypothetical protein